MKNEDIQSTAKYIADTILRGEGQDSPAESVQSLLNFVSDHKTHYPHATEIAQAVLDYILEAATPEQVVL